MASTDRAYQGSLSERRWLVALTVAVPCDMPAADHALACPSMLRDRHGQSVLELSGSLSSRVISIAMPGKESGALIRVRGIVEIRT
jgi:hypothetical protein